MKYKLRILFERPPKDVKAIIKPEGVKFNYLKLIFIVQIAEISGSIDAENVCGLTGKFSSGASNLDVRRNSFRLASFVRRTFSFSRGNGNIGETDRLRGRRDAVHGGALLPRAEENCGSRSKRGF